MKNQTNDEQKTKAIADAETRIADLTIRTHWSNHSIRTDRILHHALKAHHRSIRLEARGVTTNGHICPLEAGQLRYDEWPHLSNRGQRRYDK